MRQYKRLTVKSIQAETRVGVHADGDGLYLRIRETGTKSWLYIGMLNSKRREVGLGSLRNVGLAQAREKAAEYRAAFRAGIDPVAESKARKASLVVVPTFGEFTEVLLGDIEAGFRNEKHRKQWRSTLETHAANLAAHPVDAIDTTMILETLQPIWLKLPETASRVRGRIERVLDAAKARNFRSGENPARWKGHLQLLLPKRAKAAQSHHAALPFSEIASFMKKLRARPAPAARALEFTILTAARSGEVLGMTWDEIDVPSRTWIVPADRMKAAVEHRVPLAAAADAVLKKMYKDGVQLTDSVFVGDKGAPLSNMAMSMLLRRMGYTSITVHGFRSTFRDWAGECADFAREDVEMALAHTVASKTERAYRRGSAIEKRRNIMRAWERYCGAESSNET